MDKRDIEMMSLAVPVVDYWEMKEEIDRLGESVDRLEKIVRALVTLYHEERVKNWQLILKEMIQRTAHGKNRTTG